MARALVLRSWRPLKWPLHATNATVTSPRLYRTFTNPIALAVMQWQQPRTIARTRFLSVFRSWFLPRIFTYTKTHKVAVRT